MDMVFCLFVYIWVQNSLHYWVIFWIPLLFKIVIIINESNKYLIFKSDYLNVILNEKCTGSIFMCYVHWDNCSNR